MFRHINIACASFAVLAFATPIVAENALPQVDQAELNQLVENGDMLTAFEQAFEAGDELTEHSFTAEAGVGANIGEGRLFTRFPRADLDGPTEWANHYPVREGGANATSCIACHNTPFANGSGDIALNVVVDPAHTGDPSLYLERNTLPLFALGIPQRLAEEMSIELASQRAQGASLACAMGSADVALTAKDISFGSLTISRTSDAPCVLSFDTAAVSGVDDDLIVRPFGWKGNAATIREFTRGAAHNELGLQATELVGEMDGDFDGVFDELTVGDMTALTIYMAALERPVSTIELADLNLIEMTDTERFDILAGEQLFASTGCTSCHTPSMTFEDATFREPTVTSGFYDVQFPDGSDPQMHGLSAETAIAFDMTQDQPNNHISLADGSTQPLGSLAVDAQGTAYAMFYSDLRRHDMGEDLADPSDPLGIGASVFLTRSLAGVGSTGPWLHDGRATTLEVAIRAHGGEGRLSRESFVALPEVEKQQVLSFLESLVIYSADAH